MEHVISVTQYVMQEGSRPLASGYASTVVAAAPNLVTVHTTSQAKHFPKHPSQFTYPLAEEATKFCPYMVEEVERLASEPKGGCYPIPLECTKPVGVAPLTPTSCCRGN